MEYHPRPAEVRRKELLNTVRLLGIVGVPLPIEIHFLSLRKGPNLDPPNPQEIIFRHLMIRVYTRQKCTFCWCNGMLNGDGLVNLTLFFWPLHQLLLNTGKRYTTALDAMGSIYMLEGAKRMCRGNIPRMAWYITTSALTFMAVEFLRDHFNEELINDNRKKLLACQ